VVFLLFTACFRLVLPFLIFIVFLLTLHSFLMASSSFTRRFLTSRALSERLQVYTLKADGSSRPSLGCRARRVSTSHDEGMTRQYATGSLSILGPADKHVPEAHANSPWNMQVADCDQRRAKVNIADLDRDKDDRERIVILGSGGHIDSLVQTFSLTGRRLGRLQPLPEHRLQEVPSCYSQPTILLCFHAPPRFHLRWYPGIQNGGRTD